MAETTTEADALALHVARLFFGEQQTKTVIAQRLGISRFRVARMLDDALARGIVTIHFREPETLDLDLGAAVAGRFGLAMCLAATGTGEGDGPVAPVVAQHAAGLLGELLGPDELLGVAWGTSVAAVIDALATSPARCGQVVQLAGGTRRIDPLHAPSELASRLANHLGATLHPLYAPALVDSMELRDALLAEPEIRGTVNLYDRIDTALIGIGAFSPTTRGDHSALIASRVLSDTEVSAAVAAGAVADLVLHAVGADGGLVSTALEERAIAIGFDQLRRIPRVVAIAVGVAKAAAIAAALRTGVVSILVTDAAAAREILTLS